MIDVIGLFIACRTESRSDLQKPEARDKFLAPVIVPKARSAASIDHCLQETGRNRGTPANGKDELGTGTNPRVLHPVHASRYKRTAPAIPRVRRPRIASSGWDQRSRGNRCNGPRFSPSS